MSATSFLDGRVTLHAGDSRDVLATLPDASIDSVVTDPPYALVSISKRFGKEGAAPAIAGKTGAYARASAGFMGQQWDTGETAFAVEFWAQVYRVLKPGGHVVAFSGTRTYHRMVCAIEDAGFEIRDQIGWLYASGFPKSHDVSKGIDKAAGAVREVVGRNPNHRSDSGIDYAGVYAGGNTGAASITAPATDAARQWQGWGTALKPAWEPIVLARKPLEGTVAANVLAHGTGAVNVDGCRVGMSADDAAAINAKHAGMDPASCQRAAGVSLGLSVKPMALVRASAHGLGRWPANIVHDGSDEVVAAFPETHSAGAAGYSKTREAYEASNMHVTGGSLFRIGDNGGSAARFFYSAKADADDRIGSKHPTVKPVDLMQWLCRLVTPPGGTVLDPFAGTGTTGEAAWREGFRAVLIEREAAYREDIARRMALCLAGPDERRRESIKAKTKDKPVDLGPLFGALA